MGRAEGARGLALEILLRVERGGAYASILLADRERRLDDPRESALLHELVLGVLRRQAALDHALARVASRAPDAMDPPVRAALRVGAYSLLYLDRVPDFAAVDSAVETIKRLSPRSAGFVNGVLRALAAGGPALLPPPPEPGDAAGLALHHSHPVWWSRRLVERMGWNAAERLLAASNLPAATVLRPNLARATAAEVAERLAEEGVATQPCAFVPEALRVVAGRTVDSEVLRRGLAWVQDEAAQLVPMLFDGPIGPRAVDLCAAPGGKTFQLAERLLAGGCVLACDRHRGRLGRLARAAERLALPGILPLCADMRAGRTPLRGPFRQVLVDAPCSGSGTLRRRPEIRWRLRESSLKLMAARQRELMRTAAALCEPRGSIVYSVCSVEPEEGEQVVRQFLAEHSTFRLADPRPALPPPARGLVRETGFLETSPLDGGLDGFFAALLERRDGP